MTRTTVSPQVINGAYDTTPCTTLTWTNADSGAGNRVRINGQQIILVRNAHATLAKTVTVTSVADPFGRSKDLTAHSLLAGAVHCLARFPLTGWRQSDGYLYIDGEDSNIQFAVLDLSTQASFTA